MENMKKIITSKEDMVFLCLGCPKYPLDSFAPRLGSELKKLGFTVYGTVEEPIDGRNYIEKCLDVVFKYKDKKVIAVDSAIGKKENLGKVKVKPNRGVEPTSALGGFFTIEVGNSSIIGITSCSIKQVLKKKETKVNVDKMVKETLEEILKNVK